MGAEMMIDMVDDTKLEQTKMVCAHSSGGGTAFEVCRVLLERGIQPKCCLLDCYVHLPWKPSPEDIVRFLMKPFLEMEGKKGIENVPACFLEDIFVKLLRSCGYGMKDCEEMFRLLKSEENVAMITKMNEWRPSGTLHCNLIFVRSSSGNSDSDPSAPWKEHIFGTTENFSVVEDHYGMMEKSARILLEN